MRTRGASATGRDRSVAHSSLQMLSLLIMHTLTGDGRVTAELVRAEARARALSRLQTPRIHRHAPRTRARSAHRAAGDGGRADPAETRERAPGARVSARIHHSWRAVD